MRNGTSAHFPHSGSVTYRRKDDDVKLLNNTDSFACVINEGEDDEIVCYAFAKSKFKLFCYYLLALCSGCLVVLLGYWYPCRYIYVTCKPCSLEDAEVVVVKDSSGHSTVCIVKKEKVFEKEKSTCRDKSSTLPSIRNRESQYYRFFVFKCLRYVWEREKKAFVELRGLDKCVPIEKLTQKTKGLSQEEREVRLRLFGTNKIDVPLKSCIRIFIELCVNPFYFVMLLSCGLWLFEGYYILPSIVLALGFLSLFIGSFLMHKRLCYVQKLVRRSGMVDVVQRQSNKTENMDSEKLVPGDVLLLNGGQYLHCDAVIIKGYCTVTQDSLTGRSGPSRKYALTKAHDTSEKSPGMYSMSLYQKQTVYCGSKILHTSSSTTPEPTHAVVVATGFATSQGRMVKNVLYKSHDILVQYRDALKFIIVNVVICACVFCASLYFLIIHKVADKKVILRALSVITTAVSPLLPICTILTYIATIWRLHKGGVVCTDLKKLSQCGRTNVVCFDKTGTLTQSRVNFSHAVPAEKGLFVQVVRNGSSLQKSLLRNAVVSCHALCLNQENTVIGDPLDVEIFNQTGWKLAAAGYSESAGITPIVTVESQDNEQIFIWKQFPFYSELKRMAVVVTEQHSRFIYVYTKGDPEVISNMCTAESLPINFRSYLDDLTNAGYRVIAYACKREEKPRSSFPERVTAITRDEVERHLTFLGFIALENNVKDECGTVIPCLQKGGIRTVMVTGDNLRTAAAVGRQCQIVTKEDPVVEITVENNNDLTFRHVSGICSVTSLENRKESDVSSAMSEEIANQEHLLGNGELSEQSTIELDTLISAEGARKVCPTDHHIAITGNELSRVRANHKQCYKKILVSGKIFAEMSPRQKAQLVRDMKEMCLSVCMCGDGANDSMAIKEANTGIALSDSVAAMVTPFASKVNNITCILTLLLEGRAALVTLCTCFKYLILCSLTEFVSSIYLQYFNTEFTYLQRVYLYVLAWIAAVVMAVEARPSWELSAKRPANRLLNPMFFISIFAQVVLQGIFLAGLLYFVQHFPWYEPPEHYRHGFVKTFENTIAFTTLGVQFLHLAAIIYEGAPFCRRFHDSARLIMIITVLWILAVVIMIHPGRYLQDIFSLREIPDYTLTIAILIICLGHSFLCFIFEKQILRSRAVKGISKRICGRKVRKSHYKSVIADSVKHPLMAVDNLTSG